MEANERKRKLIMVGNEAIVEAITKSKGRKSLYHFTRERNLPAIAHLDILLSSAQINPDYRGERRLKAEKVIRNGYSMMRNAHLRIPDSMMDPEITQEQFRVCLDQHVFFWPTLKDCQKMISTYKRREPEERFSVLEFDAASLLSSHYSTVKLSKYDSGSSPRFPARCSYKKSLNMFLPLDLFKVVLSNLVPGKASEIKEVLIEEQVLKVSSHLRSVYVENKEDLPKRWSHLGRPLADLQDPSLYKHNDTYYNKESN